MPQWISLPGLVDYNKALDLMQKQVEAVISAGSQNEAIFLLEHSDIYTAGTGDKKPRLIDKTDIPIIHTGRGGKATYHGPGQRVIYPILNLASEHREKDLKLYIRNLEQWIINTMSAIGVKAYTINDMVGIWVNDSNQPAKIAAIGIRVRKWVTYHGIAVNISTDLSKFSSIIPCGISKFPVTSLNNLGIEISLSDFDNLLQQEFRKIFC
jgi:lipoyl(octanoyl) transferase